MRKILSLLTVGVLIISAITFSRCTKAKAAEVDVVTGIKPVLTDSFRTILLGRLQAATDEGRKQLMDENSARLTKQLIDFLHGTGHTCRIDSITWMYGSGKANAVKSGDGKTYNGTFEKQPYAVVKGDTSCFHSGALNVFLFCFNGTFSLTPQASSKISFSRVITISDNHGLARYMPTIEAINFAEKNNILLYKGHLPKGKLDRKKIITAKIARSLLGKKASIEISALVYDGDQIDLTHDLYLPLHRH